MPEPEKKLLVIMKPPKPVSEMTEDERHDFARRFVEAMYSTFKAE